MALGVLVVEGADLVGDLMRVADMVLALDCVGDLKVVSFLGEGHG